MTGGQRILPALLLILAGAVQAGADPGGLRLGNPEVLEALRSTDTRGLPKNLTPGERPHLRLPDLTLAPRVPPVAEHLHSASEFERNEAILMRWGNFNSVLTEMIVPITTGDSLADVLLVVASSAQQASAASTLSSAGANLDRVDFVIAPSNSVWIRDYGPRFTSADNERIIVDHEYNRPRPQDNQIPAAIAAYLNEDRYEMPIAHGGGNFHLFANGEAFMTDLILDENPGYSAQDVIDLYAGYQGVDLTLLPALPAGFDSTQHLDMWFLPVDDQTVIIGDYASPPAGIAPSSLTETVIEVTELTTSLMESRGYTVLRTPGWRAQGFSTAHHTYTNAVIVNDLVLICRFSGFTSQNAQAKALFEQAFPNKAIVPVDCSSIINSAGALHCIVKHKPFRSTFTLEVQPQEASLCLPPSPDQEASVDVQIGRINGHQTPVVLSAVGLPGGVSSEFDPGSLTGPGSSEWTLGAEDTAVAGVYQLTLAADDGGEVAEVSFVLTLEDRPDVAQALNPANAQTGVALRPQFDWASVAEAAEYRIQIATDLAFSELVVDQTAVAAPYVPDLELGTGTDHYWRIQARNHCGDGDWSAPSGFRTRFDPIAHIDPSEVQLEIPQDSLGAASMLIANIGSGELNWTLAPTACDGQSSVPGLTVAPGAGVLAAGESRTIDVAVDTTGVAVGAYQGALCLTTNEAEAEPKPIPLELQVTDPTPGELLIEPAELVFGDVALETGRTLAVTLTNAAAEGAGDLVLGQIEVIAGQAVFALGAGDSDCTDPLPAQSSCTVPVRFSPSNPGAFSGVLRIVADGAPANVGLSGNGVEPGAQIFRDRFSASP